ncbi:alpha/beta hydrolase (plasmid) [Rhizobium grahamii]|uniref:Alpha/beta hydrolase n=1 Tax=Rhizobium grahamii TaxID=1120045 RepID=A0A5Q0CFM4_9HYPH|nr:alpha/beta hydrolase [Rhizobium grahamii]QRM53003.1 alpha/beta hydrolase [Rhizobium sp. BG6]
MQSVVVTSHASIAVEETQGDGQAVLFIHGNSTCRRVFRKQFRSPLAEKYRFISIDLPGHGDSSDAADPSRTYTRPGLADAVLETVERKQVESAVIVGWSLGGHITIEMLARSKLVTALLLVGTPPVGDDIRQGFRGKPLGGLASQSVLSQDEITRFVEGIFGTSAEPFMRSAVARTDPQFRATLFAAAAKGEGVNQRQTLSATSRPTAMVNGAEDTIVNLDYIDGVDYGNLWRGHCVRIPNCAHAPFWQAPEDFNVVLTDFLADIAEK